MNFDTPSPCGSCPYRKDAPLGLWHPSEFDNLALTERDTFGSVFACHATAKKPEHSVCAGWLLSQREAGVPSLALRMRLMRDDAAVAALKAVTDGGHELYESVQDMIDANETLGRCPWCGRYLKDGVCPAGDK